MTENNKVEHFDEDSLEIVKENPVTKKNEKVLTEKQKAFLSALGNEAGGDIKTAMKLAGYSDNTRPEDVLRNISDEIMDVANKLLTNNSVKAVTKLINVLDNPANPGNKDVIAAAKELLDRAGLFKKDAGGGGTNIKADAVFILPAKEPIDKTKLIE